MKQRYTCSPDTVKALREAKWGEGRTLRELAEHLGYPVKKIAMLSDVLANKSGKLTLETENDLRKRLGLEPRVRTETEPCPTCLRAGSIVVHAAGLDCGGLPVGAVLVVRPWEDVTVKEHKPKRRQGKRIYSDEQRKRKQHLGLTWSQVIERGLRAAEDELRMPCLCQTRTA